MAFVFDIDQKPPNGHCYNVFVSVSQFFRLTVWTLYHKNSITKVGGALETFLFIGNLISIIKADGRSKQKLVNRFYISTNKITFPVSSKL